MSSETARLIEAYEALPPREKEIFLRELLLHLPQISLRERGINEQQASDLRARLKTFSEDWDRPETSIYDENSPR